MPSHQETHAAFFYGTLMLPAILNRVIQNPSIAIPSSRITTSPAVLPAFRRHRVKRADYPAILPSKDKDASVQGVLVCGLSDADMRRLDRFEGDEYRRRDVQVQVLEAKNEKSNGHGEDRDNKMVRAETYVWIAGKDQLEGREWDFEEFRREKLGRWLGRDSTEYQDVEKGQQDSKNGSEDPTRGRGPDGDIGKALEEDREGAKEVFESAV